MLDRVRELVRRERADALLHRVQDAKFGRWHRLRWSTFERPDEPVVRVLLVRLAAVPGHAFGADLQPDDLLLGDRDAVYELARREQVAAAEAPFVDHVFGIELGVMVRDHPPRAHRAADFLVGLGEQDDVAIERHALALQPQKRQELRDAHAFHVHRAAAPQYAVAAIVGGNGSVFHCERSAGTTSMWWSSTIALPAGGAVAFETRIHDRLARRRFVPGDGNPLAIEDRGQPVGGLSRIARRIGSVDADVFAEQACRFVRRLRADKRHHGGHGQDDTDAAQPFRKEP